MANYQIKLHIDENVPPVAQPHRRVPFHVRKQLEEQLRRDEELGVVERIESPTPWVSPIVVAPKPKSPGKVHVCSDMRQANKAIKRERQVTPTIKEMIGDLNGAKVFTKLDLNQGYNQLELAPESRYITTFGTHMGLMRCKRLNFGISSAAEIFQNVIRETLQGIDGAIKSVTTSWSLANHTKNMIRTWGQFSSVWERKDWPSTTKASVSIAKTSWNFSGTCSLKMAYHQTRRQLKKWSIFRRQEKPKTRLQADQTRIKCSNVCFFGKNMTWTNTLKLQLVVSRTWSRIISSQSRPWGKLSL